MALKLVDEQFKAPMPDIREPSLAGAAAHVRMAIEHLAMARSHIALGSADSHDSLREAMTDASVGLGLVMARLGYAFAAEERKAD